MSLSSGFATDVPSGCSVPHDQKLSQYSSVLCPKFLILLTGDFVRERILCTGLFSLLMDA